jgi:hypothetical protein
LCGEQLFKNDQLFEIRKKLRRPEKKIRTRLHGGHDHPVKWKSSQNARQQ